MKLQLLLGSQQPSAALLVVFGIIAGLCAGAGAIDKAEYADLPTSQLVSRGDVLLANQHVQAALDLYDLAVQRDPSIYLNLYKRGTTHLALKQTQKALADFNAVLALTEFDQARLQIARIHLKEGSYQPALDAITAYLARNKKDAAAQDLKKSIAAAQSATKKLEKAKQKKQWEQCITAANEALAIAESSVHLLESRSDCAAQLGRIEEAVGDLTRAVSISPSAPHLLVRLSLLSALYLNEGGPASSTTPVKQCLHFDPENKICKRLFRQLKSLDKDLSQVRNFVEGELWRKALNILDPKKSSADDTARDPLVKRAKDIIAEFSTSSPTASKKDDLGPLPKDSYSTLLTRLYGWTCKSYISLNSQRSAKPFCAEVYARDPDNIDGLVGMGEAALKEENFEEAVRMLSSAFEKSGRSDRNILEKVQKAQKLLKQSKAKDYYKVLGVPRDADAATIRKAYRKATLKNHPDKEGGSEEKMAAVNEAYEVLSKPELKARYDNGDDPNDPMSGHGGPGGGGGGGFHGNPFYGSPGGGMGGQQFFQQFFQQGGGGGPFAGGFPGGQGGGGQRVKFQWG